MPLLPSASDSEPFLILTDQDYEKAVAPEATPEPPPAKAVAAREPRPAAPPPPPKPAQAAPTRPAPKRPPRTGSAEPKPQPKRWGLRAAAALLLLGGAGGGLWWTTRPAPVAAPVAVSAPLPKPMVQVEAPPPVPPPAPRPRPPRVVEPPPVEEPVVEETPPAVVAAPSEPWSGGRAWIEVRLKMDYRGSVQELQRKVVIAWDGSRFLVERPSGQDSGLWLQRLQLLLQLPQAGESLPRQMASVAKDSVTCSGRTMTAERVEGEDRFPQEHRRFTYWTTPEFGAGAVRASVVFPDVSVELQILDFGPEPGTARNP